LTTARYFTPNGRSIQAKGIIPDIIVKPALPEEEKVVPSPKPPAEKDLERHLSDNKEKEKTKKEEVKEKKPSDPQLERALELLKSWEIFKSIVNKGK
jgi:carboxyl-terminal processing protease